MGEMRVMDPVDNTIAVRMKLTQGALGICDLYVTGVWVRRTTWSPLAGFADMPFHNGLCCELAKQVHDLVTKRGRRGAQR
jgi:hypothetical protein